MCGIVFAGVLLATGSDGTQQKLDQPTLVIVISNGFTCPLMEFCGRHVPDRFGDACAARPITTTAVASATATLHASLSSSFVRAMLTVRLDYRAVR
jgi:hypothetical protein